MSSDRVEQPNEDLTAAVWDLDASQRCVVCSRPSGGKAICDDARCAQELAHG